MSKNGRTHFKNLAAFASMNAHEYHSVNMKPIDTLLT